MDLTLTEICASRGHWLRLCNLPAPPALPQAQQTEETVHFSKFSKAHSGDRQNRFFWKFIVFISLRNFLFYSIILEIPWLFYF